MKKSDWDKKFPEIHRNDREIRIRYVENQPEEYDVDLYEGGALVTTIKFGGVATMQETIRHWCKERLPRVFDKEKE